MVDPIHFVRHKKYRQRTGFADARGQICNRVSIEARPAIVNQKVRIGRLGGGHGDWQRASGCVGDAIRTC